MGSSSGTTTTTNKTEPSDAWKSYAPEGLEMAKYALNKQTEYYPGQQIADKDWRETSYNDLVTDKASKSASTYADANQMLNDTISGKYLSTNSNPWLSGYYDTAWNKVKPNYTTAATKYGAYGSTDAANAMASGASDLANTLYGDAYKTERQNQLNAVGYLPTMQKLEYTDYDRLRDVGTENREYEQELIDAAKQKWDYTSNDGWNKAQKYANIMSLMLGGSGGTQTTEKPYYTNTAGNILGGLTSGIGTLSGLSGATSGIKSLLSLF